MDERLEKALEFANFMVTLNNQKRNLKEQYQTECIHYCSGGTFTINKDLITFTKVLIDLGNIENVVLIDDNELPVRINDLKEFFENIVDQYFLASNSYYTEYQNLKKNRNVEALIK